MSNNNNPVVDIVGYILGVVLAFFINVWFVKWGLNAGMPELLEHAGGHWNAISWDNALDVTFMLWFVGGALVSMNTMHLARRSDVN